MSASGRDLQELLRALPSVDLVVGLVGQGGRAAAVARDLLDELRQAVREGRAAVPLPDAEALAAEVTERLAAEDHRAYPAAVNASGVFLHTGLGRAPLATAAARALAEIAPAFSVLEVDPATGERNRREEALTAELCALIGAEAATVVNNNAAALLLGLRALSSGREVIVSRGQLIEIGGGFRLPEVMTLSGGTLVEVGTTNRTYAKDYAEAITDDTGLLLWAHPSNFRVIGFEHAPSIAELSTLGHERDIPFFADLGSGLLVPPPPGVLSTEPDAATALADGADLVCFSGDKLLGGPQAGILAGRAELVEACRGDALFRPLRPDRLALAALAATLRLHREAPGEVPVLRALQTSAREHLEHARGLARRIGGLGHELELQAIVTEGQVGSGSVPGREVKSAAVEIRGPGFDADEVARRLRVGNPTVFARTWKGALRLDVLALLPGDDDRLLTALEHALS